VHRRFGFGAKALAGAFLEARARTQECDEADDADGAIGELTRLGLVEELP
jgi:hypothetical protein